ncbi:hypothetical protein BsWGS_06271 [Bradybaena similaris]
MCQDNFRLMLAVLLVCFLHMTDGCGRTPARTKPQETTVSPVERSTARPSGHSARTPASTRLQCTQDEVKEAACLNGGACFALDLLESRSAFCQCSEIWKGTRCEQFDDSVFVLSADKVEKAGIAAGVVVLIIITTVIIVYLVVKRRKQRKERAEANGNANGHAGKALMSCDKGTFDSDEGEKCTDV